MGLDQWAYKRKSIKTSKDKNSKPQKVQEALLMEWRKHANLEGWMANLYYEKGGMETFNCIDLPLTAGDLKELSSVHKILEEAKGFFWGESTPEDIEKTAKFIDLALKAIQDGYEIIYRSWW